MIKPQKPMAPPRLWGEAGPTLANVVSRYFTKVFRGEEMIEISGITSVFFGGASGVLVVEAAKFVAASMGQKAKQKTKMYRIGTYWLGLLILILIAGFITVINVGEGPIKVITAIQIGINAPALVTAWATASQRDRIARQSRISAGVAPIDSNRNELNDQRSLLRKILEDQAW